LPVRLFPLWVLIDILSFVRLLLSQQPDNTHGIYQRRRSASFLSFLQCISTNQLSPETKVSLSVLF